MFCSVATNKLGAGVRARDDGERMYGEGLNGERKEGEGMGGEGRRGDERVGLT